MTGQDFFFHTPLPRPLPSVSVCVKTPGAPPLASYLSLPPATWLNGTLTPRHAESESHFPVWDGGGFHVASPPIKTFFYRYPLAPFSSLTGNKGRCQELSRYPPPPPTSATPTTSSPPLSRSPATWLNGNPTSQDLKSHSHGSVSIDNRTLLAPSRPRTDHYLPAHLSSVTYRYQEGRWWWWRQRRWWCSPGHSLYIDYRFLPC